MLLYWASMFTCPIFINTFVVFVRLYWFEKRFNAIAKDARNLRRTRTRTMTQPRNEHDLGNVEEGIRGRSIVVMHDGHMFEPRPTLSSKKVEFEEESGSGSSSDRNMQNETVKPMKSLPEPQDPPFHRDIMFADEVRRPSDIDKEKPMLPQRLSPEQHIAFLENQRNPKDKGALRIPGPREYDEGYEPKQLNEDDARDGGELEHETTNTFKSRRNIQIDEPQHRRLRVNTAHSQNTTNQHSMDGHDEGQTPVEKAPFSARLRARTGTFSSIRGWASTENDHITPYLSYQTTIGRNSDFVNLTEEQREELGGIEYRSLKTLALVLISA